MKIVILSHEPFRNYMKSYYYIEEFQRDGYEVEYWCVQEALKYSSSLHYNHRDHGSNILYFNDIDALIDCINSLSSATIVMLDIWLNWDTIKIFKTIKNKSLKTFQIDYFRNYPLLVTRLSKVKQALMAQDYLSIITAFIRIFKRKAFDAYANIIGISTASVVFIPGKRGLSLGGGQAVVSISHYDATNFEKSVSKAFKPEKPYMVFLDSYLNGHPDIARLNQKPIDSEVYFAKMNKAFKQIENELKVDIVIAAHPKSNYTYQFGDRIVLKNNTSELIHNCQGVLAHHSISINYAVLAKKQVCLLYTDDFVSSEKSTLFLKIVYDAIKGYQELLNCSIVNIDRPFSPKQFKVVDEICYSNFIQNYILAAGTQRSNYDIIKGEIDRSQKA